MSNGCGSPHTERGYQAFFVFPCEGSPTGTYPVVRIHVSAYPPQSDGGFTVVQKVLTDRNGAVEGLPVFGMIPGGISPETNESSQEHTWSHDLQVGTKCIGDTGRTALGIYLLTRAGVQESEHWRQGRPIGRMPAGSTLMDQVTVERRGTCPSDDDPTPTPDPTGPAPSPSGSGTPTPTPTNTSTPTTTSRPTPTTPAPQPPAAPSRTDRIRATVP